MFRNHAFRPTLTPVEGNFLGTKYGMGSFEQIYAKVEDAIEYKNNPWEKYVEEGQTKEKKMSIDINEEVATTEKELGNKNVMLTCGDSSYLEIEDKSVDAVITDPPYFDNVQYSELSDFYYVWLREALKEEYDYFQSEYAPKSAEAVKNNAQDKGKDEFTDSLTQILAESRRKLKDDGLMAFTFHHQETDAWSSVLESVLDAGFYITAIYPVQAEMDTSMHIREKDNVNYDMIIVCRKRDDEPEEGIWSEMQDRIYLEAKNKIAELEEEGEHVARGDQFVIVLGKCLEIYSEHYPEVYRDGERVSVGEALDSIREIVEDQIQGGKFDEIADKTDTLSAIYLSYIAGRGKERSYSSLNKTLQQSGLNIGKLTESNLVKSESGQIIDLSPSEISERVDDRDNASAMEKAASVIHLKEKDELLENIGSWMTKEAISALKMYDKRVDQEYEELVEFVEDKTKNRSFNAYGGE
jgi:adenine-specific DNA methylase